jgi:hypothetical protein
MEHLDKQHHQTEASSEYTLIGGVMENLEVPTDPSTGYTIIGGNSSELKRCPSSLAKFSPSHTIKSSGAEKCPRCQLRRKKKKKSGSTSSADDTNGSSTCSSIDGGAGGGSVMIMRWDEDDVMAWLGEAGFGGYTVSVDGSCKKPAAITLVLT